jgi:hypothetical protein
MPMNPRLLRPTSSTLDADAAVYLNAVAQADGEQLEPAVRKAINDLVVGLKRDGIWSAIKASCLLAGPRTLAGINVPLVGPTPTFNAFTATEYNRKTGLKGDGSTMYIDSKRNNNADPQDSHHLAVYASEVSVANRHYIGVGGTGGLTQIVSAASVGGALRSRSRSGTSSTGTGADAVGFLGKSRASSASHDIRASQTTSAHSVSSTTPVNSDIFVFGNNTSGVLTLASNPRLAFYSIGEAIDLALLDTRVSAYYTAIQAAI